jgi:hypothetical protein
MESDPELRRTLLADSEIDGLLRAFGESDLDAETFVRAIGDFLSAEKDATGSSRGSRIAWRRRDCFCKGSGKA